MAGNIAQLLIMPAKGRHYLLLKIPEGGWFVNKRRSAAVSVYFGEKTSVGTGKDRIGSIALAKSFVQIFDRVPSFFPPGSHPLLAGITLKKLEPPYLHVPVIGRDEAVCMLSTLPAQASEHRLQPYFCPSRKAAAQATGDADGDGKIGLAEAVLGLQQVSGLR